MVNKSSGTGKTQNKLQKDTLESIRDRSSDGFLDQFFGQPEYPDYPFEKPATPKTQKKEFKLFSYQEHYENTLIKKEIKDLTEQIKREIELIKRADKALINEVKDIEKISVESLPDKPGMYHVRFMELVLSILRTLRAKIGESRTWLAALSSKKKKRGSLFASRSKKQGTQYSLSQELQSARSVQ